MNNLVKTFIENKCQSIVSRLGINTQFTIEEKGFEITSTPFKTMPVIFEKINLEGVLYYDNKEHYSAITVCLSYKYTHFDGGRNGCKLGNITFRVSGGFTPDNIDDEYFIRVYSQDILTF